LFRLTRPEEIQPYLSDASQFSGEAEGVFLPENEKEIADFLREAVYKKFPVTVSGGRTGLTGAAVPRGGWVLSTEKLGKVLEVHRDPKGKDSWARLEPALRLKEIQQALEPEDLFYPPDPTGPKAFLGGTLATNASGPNSLKYGATRGHVRRIRVVLAGGEILDLERGKIRANAQGLLEIPLRSGKLRIPIPRYPLPGIKHAGGYFAKPGMDAVDLFIGSEGTLGVMTQITVTLLPKPETVLVFMAFFRKEEDSWRLVESVRKSKSVSPRVLEYFDGGSLEFLRPSFPSIPREARACLLIEQESSSRMENKFLEAWRSLFEKGGALAEIWEGHTPEKQEEFRNFRSALPLAVRDFLAEHHQVKIGTDTAVPHERFEELMLFHRGQVEAGGFQSVTFGHIGESHVHLNLLPRNDEESHRGWALYPELVRKAVSLGGTFSAEHGVGKLKRRYLAELFGNEAIREMVAVKRSFDPNLILGQGNVFEIQ